VRIINTLEIFGNRLKELRNIKGMSQEVISDALGISRPAYAKIEKGMNKTLPSHAQIDIIARKLGVDPKTLYGADKFILDRFTDEERELMENPESTNYIKLALAKMREDKEYATKSLYQQVKDSSANNTIVGQYGKNPR